MSGRFLLFLMAVTVWTGATLVLSELRWFRRPGLVDRLTPYAPGHRAMRQGPFSVGSFRDVVAPLSREFGERLAGIFGVREDLDIRLRRIHSPLDGASVRVRQLCWSGSAFIAGVLLAVVVGLPVPVAVLVVIGAPVLAFLVVEQRIMAASDAWQQRLFAELPVIAEQLGMLTSAGWSLGAAMQRIGARGTGSCAADLRRVTRRIQQGLDETAALREWGDLADVEAMHRLIEILALNREAADLGRLISNEAQAIRRDAQRVLIEAIERRNQQVWIPVTVAALVPGVLLMGVPFIDALTVFSSS